MKALKSPRSIIPAAPRAIKYVGASAQPLDYELCDEASRRGRMVWGINWHSLTTGFIGIVLGVLLAVLVPSYKTTSGEVYIDEGQIAIVVIAGIAAILSWLKTRRHDLKHGS